MTNTGFQGKFYGGERITFLGEMPRYYSSNGLLNHTVTWAVVSQTLPSFKRI